MGARESEDVGSAHLIKNIIVVVEMTEKFDVTDVSRGLLFLFESLSIAEETECDVVIVGDLIEDIKKYVYIIAFNKSARKEDVVVLFGERGTSDLLDIDPVRHDFDALAGVGSIAARR